MNDENLLLAALDGLVTLCYAYLRARPRLIKDISHLRVEESNVQVTVGRSSVAISRTGRGCHLTGARRRPL